MIETLLSGPAIERPRHAGLPIGDIVILAKKGGAVSILSQDLRHHCCGLRNLAGVSGERISQLCDGSRSRRVMISARKQSSTRWGTERRSMKTDVPQTRFCKAVQVRGRNLSAESTPLPEAAVVN